MPILIAIADGTEEMEAVITIDLLRRAQIEVVVASVMSRLNIVASRGVGLVADVLIENCLDTHWDMVILPGGMPGAQHLSESKPLIEILEKQQRKNGWIAAICAAPQVVLGQHEFLLEHTATCYPGFRDKLATQCAHISDSNVVVSGKFITSQGPGTAAEFALEIIKATKGKEAAKGVAEAALLKY